MTANGPMIVLRSTPGLRITSRSSLPVKEPMRIRLPIGRLAVADRAALPDELREDLVECRLLLLDPGHADPGVAKRLHDPWCQRPGTGDGRDEGSRPALSHVLYPVHGGQQVRIDRTVRGDLEHITAEGHLAQC